MYRNHVQAPRCWSCRADMHGEQNLFRMLLVTPPPIFPLFDALVSFFDEEQWRDHQARRRWFDERTAYDALHAQAGA